MHKSGTTIVLTAGEWQATIVTVGAGLSLADAAAAPRRYPARPRGDAARASG